MNYKKLIKILHYDDNIFNKYLEYQNFLMVKDVVTFEDLLLDKNFLASYLLNPVEIEKSYLSQYDYSVRSAISYREFCRQFGFYPFVQKDEDRFCSNCKYSNKIAESDYMCLEDYVPYDGYCDEHVFATR